MFEITVCAKVGPYFMPKRDVGRMTYSNITLCHGNSKHCVVTECVVSKRASRYMEYNISIPCHNK